MLAGSTAAVVHDTAAADVRQPTDNGYSTADDRRTAGHGSARNAVANAADPSTPAAPTEPTRNDAGRLCAGRRSQRRCLESPKFHGSCPVAVGYLCWTVGGGDGRTATKCRTTGPAAAAAENHLVRSVID